MAETTVARPFGEADLRDQLGPDPVDAALERQRAIDRGVLLLEASEAPGESLQRLLRVAGPDLAGVQQFAVLVVADHQGAESAAAPPRFGEAVNHQLLLVHALDLEPVSGAAVRAVSGGALGDQP